MNALVRSALLAAALMAATQPSEAQSKGNSKKAKAAAAAPAAPTDKKVTIASKLKNAVAYDGLMKVYQDTTDGKLYLKLSADQFNREFIYWSYAENGVASVGFNRGSFRANEVFRIRRYLDQVQFEIQNTAYYFDPSTALSKSAEANISPAVLLSEKVIAEDRAKGEVLIDATGLFLGEVLDRVKAPSTPGSREFGLGTLSKTKSRLTNVRSYPENTDVVVDLVYDNPNGVGGGPDVTDSRYVTVRLQHSILAMPASDYVPRRDDARVGYFGQQINDMTSPAAANYRDVINRWKLVKKNPDEPLSEPVEPITWWIENTTPMEFRDVIQRAGEAWNEAFEKAGFKNAVVVKVQPDDANWDAGDIRYNVLRWTSSPFPPFGGYGPSFTNPRTGQILGADIMFEYVFVANRLKQAALYNNLGLVDALAEEPEHESDHGDHAACRAGHYLQQSALFGMQALAASGASEAQKKRYLEESLYYLVLHEMGHTFGLNHNMKASQLHLPKDIHNRALTEQVGLVGSVMDYPAVNVSLDPSKQGQYFTTKPGPYDLWAIEYGYSTGHADADAEEARLNEILARSTEPALTFGNDADDMRSPGKAIDPRVNVNDMSGDAIAYGVERMQLVNKLYGTLLSNYRKDGQSYQELVQAYAILGGEVNNAASAISRYVGGVYVERGFPGQPGAKDPFTPVSLADQKRAMNALKTYVFAPTAFDAAAPVWKYLQQQRRGFGFFSQTEDPKVHDRSLAIQRNVLAHLLHPAVMKRLTDSKLYGNQYSVAAMTADLTDALFAADWTTSVNGFRQNAQLEYVDRLLDIAGLSEKPASGYDRPSQSAALAQIQRIRQQVRLNPGTDAETKAHRAHLALKLDKALD
ncbi:MAG: zinc-dependent metalloprotease [Schleiferiaceae bacterium]